MISRPAVAVRGLEKRYGRVEAVRGVIFEVPPGETFGFLGPNGAGKSTTINILCTLVRPTAGEARVAGHDVVTGRTAVRRAIGLVFQDPTLDADLTAEQNLRFYGGARPAGGRHAADGRPDRPAAQPGRHLLRRHEAPAG